KGSIEIKKASKGGLNIILNGKIVDGRVEDIKSILKDYKIIHAVVKINGEISLEDIETSIIGSKVYRPTIITVNKSDLIDNIEEVEKEISYISKEVEGVIFTSTITNKNLEKIGELIFKSLRLIRIYTKQPNGDVAKKPLVLKNGATVRDVASSIHSSLEEFFKYAKIWGKSAKYPGERVGLDHELQDGDIVEIYSKV
ncbi:MAG: TGS domain-containing protein, partial [Fervidicoccus sp.]